MRRLAFASSVALLLAASGCADPTAGCTRVVGPSSDPAANHTAIQAALSDAPPGSTVCMRPGTYPLHDELTISTDKLTVRSTSDGRAVLDFAGQSTGANGVTVVSVSRFTVRDLTVKNTA